MIVKGGGSHMRPRTNFVLALHGECLYSNTYKNAFIYFILKNVFSSHTCLIICLYFITYLTLINPVKTRIQNRLHIGYLDTILASIDKQIDFL